MHFEPRYRTLAQLFQQAVQKHGSRELFGTKREGRWTWTTYAEFAALVDRVRGGLASLGVGRGDRVAIIANNRVEWAGAAYACYGLGAAYVPMYEAQHPKEWDYIVRDSEAKVLLVANETILSATEALLGTVASLRNVVVLDGRSKPLTNGSSARVVSYASLLEAGKAAQLGTATLVALAPDDIASIIYTSGTTGNPKGVMLTHANIASNVSANRDVFPLQPDDRSLSFLPWAHVFGQTVELHTLLSTGASMAICQSVDRILDDLAEVQPTVLFSVPRIFNKIYAAVQQQIAARPKPVQVLVRMALESAAKERAGDRLRWRELATLKLVDRLVFAKVRARFGGRLRYAFSGGAALSPTVAEFIDSLGVMVYEGYGLTETSPIVTANWPGRRKIGSVGRPIPGVRIEIDRADRAGGEIGRPNEGEIVVYGHNVMKGYLNRPDEDKAVFTPDGGFRTGDMGYVDPDGYLFLSGRIKEQYKLENGKYVVPTPLEEALKLSPYVANAMVYGDNRTYNVALVVADLSAVRRWAESEHVRLPADDDAVLKDDRVRTLFKSEVEKFGSAFKGFEAVRDFALIATDFTTANGMLTPSLKLKRRKVAEAFGDVIDQLYSGAKGAKVHLGLRHI